MSIIDELLAKNFEWAQQRSAREISQEYQPRCLWVACSECPVQPTELTGGDHAQLLVHSNFGTLLDESDRSWLVVLQLALVDFEIQHIVICGHYGCAAANAAFSSEPLGLIDHWIDPLIELTQDYQSELEAIESASARRARFCELSVAHQVRALAGSATLRKILKAGQTCMVHGWMFQPWNRRLIDLEVSAPAPVKADGNWWH